jgi:hypothetical protein
MLQTQLLNHLPIPCSLPTAAPQSIVVTNKSSNWEKFFLGLILLLQLG